LGVICGFGCYEIKKKKKKNKTKIKSR